jgi:hypothetical protein
MLLTKSKKIVYQAFRRKELEKLCIKWGRMEEAFEEGQGR